jgi:hypothetical protein
MVVVAWGRAHQVDQLPDYEKAQIVAEARARGLL